MITGDMAGMITGDMADVFKMERASKLLQVALSLKATRSGSPPVNGIFGFQWFIPGGERTNRCLCWFLTRH